MKRSALENSLELQLRARRVREWKPEYQFAKPRRWRFDFAWPEIMLAAEVEGTTHYGTNRNGTMRLGRHQTKKGFAADCEKYNAAAINGWRVLRFDNDMVKSGTAADVIQTEIMKHGQ